MEVFKPIDGYEGYQISNMGNVKNAKTGKPLKAQISSSGYYNVTLSLNGKRYTPTIHSLVAKHFLDICNFEVNHKDGNKLNNNVGNLEWVNRSENMTHAYGIGLRKKIHLKNAKNTSGKCGVVFDKQKGKWIARMHKNSKAVYLGIFSTKEEAIECRIKAENDYK